MFLFDDNAKQASPIIKIAGIGGAGIYILHELNKLGLSTDYISFDSNTTCLSSASFSTTVQLGNGVNNNQGCGGKLEVGRQAALGSRTDIINSLHGIDLLILVAGLGGGLGSGAITIVAEAARELNIPTLSFVTKPFKFEGVKRTQIADRVIGELKSISNGVLAIDHNKLMDAFPESITLIEAFQQGATHLQLIIKQLLHIIDTNALINVDFADIRTLLGFHGAFAMGSLNSTKHVDLPSLVQSVLRHPLMEISTPFKAQGVLLFVDAGNEFNLEELSHATNYLIDMCDHSTEVIMGINSTPDCSGITVTLLATGIGSKEQKPALVHSRHF